MRIEPEVVPGYPDRILPIDAAAAAELKTRTLTNLYNARPAWLDHAHRRLDAAVAAAYGWTDWGEGFPEAEILARPVRPQPGARHRRALSPGHRDKPGQIRRRRGVIGGTDAHSSPLGPAGR